MHVKDGVQSGLQTTGIVQMAPVEKICTRSYMLEIRGLQCWTRLDQIYSCRPRYLKVVLGGGGSWRSGGLRLQAGW
jgi:hypothetical protein